jgi:IS30 family transposase
MNNQYKQLTLNERYQIQGLNELGFSARAIAIKMKRSNKTIARELRRCPNSKYCAEEAHTHVSMIRTQAFKFTKRSQELIDKVEHFLKLSFTPEQIAGRLAQEVPALKVCCNTVYRIVFEQGWRHKLARQGNPYKPRKNVMAGAHLIPNRVDIDQRPKQVDDKQEIGHWEGDTVYGQDGYLVTLTERVTKLLLTCRVKNKTKQLVSKAVKTLLKPFKHVCKTITFDNGGEFAGHQSIAKTLKCKIYFAKPYHSWQRGLNENTNGLLRRFYPKGFAIGQLTEQDIEVTQMLINLRPRKSLSYLTPIEVLLNKRVSLIADI